MSVYNHEKYVGTAIESVLSQSFSDFEFIILDNGSTDGSGEVIRRFTDPRLRHLSAAENLTAYWGVETCFNEAVGKYIAFIGSDDVWDISKLQKQIEFIEENPEYGVVFTETAMINASGARLDWTPFLSAECNMSRPGWLRYFFFFSNCVCWASCLMVRDLKPATSHAYARFKQLCDLYMWTAVLRTHGMYIYPEALTFYRQHGENESQKDVDILHNRSYLESFYILDSYRSFSVAELEAIFPELVSPEPLNELNKDYYLAKLSLDYFPGAANAKSRRMFGILTIFNMFAQKDVVEELARADNFRLNDFYSITGHGINIAYDSVAAAPSAQRMSGLSEISFKRLLIELAKRFAWKAKALVHSLTEAAKSSNSQSQNNG
jgi:glycosyltransferase involved in cell wall biosynthesis